MTEQPQSSVNARDVHGFCPACGHSTLRLGEDSRIVCTLMDCPRPDLVNELIGEIGDARHHAAFTFCEQRVGHVNMTAFARKITEKVTAVAHRGEAVAYANEQKQRAERAEEVLAGLAQMIRRERDDADIPGSPATPDVIRGMSHAAGLVDAALEELKETAS